LRFRGLRPPTSEDDVPKFVVGELITVLNDIIHGLKKLIFVDNFEAFEVDVAIPANSFVAITNQLPFTPTRYIVLRNTAGMPIGDYKPDSWDQRSIQLKNYGTIDTIIKVVVMR